MDMNNFLLTCHADDVTDMALAAELWTYDSEGVNKLVEVKVRRARS